MKNLRWIDWKGDIASPLPTNFSLRKLRCLLLGYNLQRQLWEGSKVLPPITQLKNLKILSLLWCPQLLKFSEIQQNIDHSRHFDLDNTQGNIPGVDLIDVEEGCLHDPCLPLIGLWLSHNLQQLVLRKLDLSWCGLADEATGSDVWELPNLQELNLKGNKFSRLNFSVFRLPRLKWLNVSSCIELVELSELPSSIAVVLADGCWSLESFGDISNCKWLWKLSLLWCDKLGGGDILLDSVLQGNAIEDHFITVALHHQIPKGFVGRFSRGFSFTPCHPHDTDDSGHTFTLHLPDDCSLRQTTSLNSSYNIISFSIKDDWTSFAAELVPRISEDDPLQTTKVATDSSEYWNDELTRKAFTIQHDLYSFIRILWQP
ncbi:unnamed protein product [Lactuca virosa]|uniref:Uncharacterized protein n=1 Tax=Lactuca virosa TaxID=75947 RepID=A0AAU9MUU2_9ASTR|nr:unnamed protein product [Lactuca virosa]